jgi:hypothetical protein
MKPFIAASYDPREWWTAHLCDALKTEAEVRCFPAPTESASGYSWEQPVADLLGADLERCDAFLGSMAMLHPDLTELSCPTAHWADHVAQPGPLTEMTKLFDVLFVTCHEGVDLWKQHGFDTVHYLPFAFDDTMLPEPAELRELEVAFVGALNLPIHARRRELLDALSSRFRMNDFRHRVTQREAAQIYAQSRIVVNITELPGFNMRNFEAMGQGALLLTQRTGYGIPELFQDGVHLVVYENCDDLLEKVAHYLSHDDERERIATAGRHEVLARHTYRHRAADFLQIIRNSGARRGEGRRRADWAQAYATYYRRHRRLDLLASLLHRGDLTWRQRIEVLEESALCLGRLCLGSR